MLVDVALLSDNLQEVVDAILWRVQSDRKCSVGELMQLNINS